MRRNQRLRREYIFRKSLQGKVRADFEKKRAIQKALNEGKVVPTEFRNEYDDLKLEMDAEDAEHTGAPNMIDDEYNTAGLYDPKVLITTGRNSTAKNKQFVKEMNLIFPGATRLNRGSMSVRELVGACRKNAYSDLVVIHESHGRPDGMIISHMPHGPTAFFALSDLVMRHDLPTSSIKTVSEEKPHLIFDAFTTQVGRRCQAILKYLFPVPKPDSRRLMTFANRDDYILFRHHVYKKGEEGIELREVGPRFTLRLYQILLGTLDQREADNEWVLRPYMNSAARRKIL